MYARVHSVCCYLLHKRGVTKSSDGGKWIPHPRTKGRMERSDPPRSGRPWVLTEGAWASTHKTGFVSLQFLETPNDQRHHSTHLPGSFQESQIGKRGIRGSTCKDHNVKVFSLCLLGCFVGLFWLFCGGCFGLFLLFMRPAPLQPWPPRDPRPAS